MEQQLYAQLGDLIVKWGGVAAGLSAVIALCVKVTKPIRDRRKTEKEEQAEYRRGVRDSIDKINLSIGEMSKKMDNYEEDMVYQQRYDLKMAHARQMQQGWCSDEEKAAYLDMHDHYKINRKRNSLADSCKSDIIALPNHPPQKA